MRFHPVFVMMFCLPTVLDVAERVIHRYHVSTLPFLLDEHDLPLYSSFFSILLFFFVGKKGWCFIVIIVIQRIIKSYFNKTLVQWHIFQSFTYMNFWRKKKVTIKFHFVEINEINEQSREKFNVQIVSSSVEDIYITNVTIIHRTSEDRHGRSQ